MMRPDDFAQHQAATARWMGYPDADAMNRDHDPLHLALCRFFGVESHALRQARGEALTREEQAFANLEEDAVMHLQRWMKHIGAEVPRC